MGSNPMRLPSSGPSSTWNSVKDSFQQGGYGAGAVVVSGIHAVTVLLVVSGGGVVIVVWEVVDIRSVLVIVMISWTVVDNLVKAMLMIVKTKECLF